MSASPYPTHTILVWRRCEVSYQHPEGYEALPVEVPDLPLCPAHHRPIDPSLGCADCALQHIAAERYRREFEEKNPGFGELLPPEAGNFRGAGYSRPTRGELMASAIEGRRLAAKACY